MSGDEVRHGQPVRCVLVIAAHNEEEALKNCFDAIAVAPLPEVGDWVLFDGGWTDKTVEHWCAWGELHPDFTLRVQDNSERIGKASELEQVRQVLAERSDPGIVMVACDADSRVDPSAILYLLQPFIEDTESAVSWGISLPHGPKSRRRASWFQALLVLAFQRRLGEQAIRAEGRFVAIRVATLDGFAWSPGLIHDDMQLTRHVTMSGGRHRSVVQADTYIVPARGWRDFYDQTYRYYHAVSQLVVNDNSLEPTSHATGTEKLRSDEESTWLRLEVFARRAGADPIEALAYCVARFVCSLLERFAPVEFSDSWEESRSTKVGIDLHQPVGVRGVAGAESSRSLVSALRSTADSIALSLKVLIGCRNWPSVLVVWLANTVRKLEAITPKDLELQLRSGGVVSAPNTMLGVSPLQEVFVGDAYHFDRLRWRSPSELSLSVLDIGAHVGNFTVAVAQRYTTANISSYELSPQGIAYLRSNISANHLDERVQTYEAAAAAESSSVRLYSNRDACCESSVIRSSDLSGGSEPLTIVECSAGPFEAAMRSAGGVDLVKIDCEGAEYDIILNSSLACWDSVSCVLLKYHTVPSHSWDELAKHFAGLGFTVSWLETDEGRPGLGMAMLVRVARGVLT
ncbi:MAG: FkbM family methyltransferase [Ferrimicrobium acidiphilum]